MLRFFNALYRIFRCIRECVMNLFFILFVLTFFAFTALLSMESSGQKQPVPFDKGALMLNLDGYLADNHDEFGDFQRFLQSELGATEEPLKISTFDVVRAINAAQFDDQITGLVLDLSFFEGGDIPSLNFIGKEITRFKQSGKPVIAVGEHYSQAQYYLASFADKIYLNQAGFVGLQGLSYSALYFKSLFEKIEAVPHIFRVGTYKSAVEPFIRDDMSAEARENTQLWIGQLWKNFSGDIAENRQIKPENVLPEFSQYIQKYKEAKGDDAQYALNQKLVTELVTTRQTHQLLIDQFGKNSEGSYNHIDFFDYTLNLSDRFNVNAEHKIAVINVEGEIVWGESDENMAGSDTIVPLLRQAREDDKVKGVILRINSPGGSAMASELIRQEAEAIQQSGKPVVTSMGGMAASGGYWIASTSDKIIASPNTLTGSIGIFGLALTFEKTAKNLGINEESVNTSPLANTSGFETLPKEQAELMQVSIEHGYDRFLELVSQGRKMTKQQVDRIAQGQVWLGESAFEKGLVDQLGDFGDAYTAVVDLVNQQRKAKGQAEIEQFATQWFIDEERDFLSQIMRDFKMKLKLNLSAFLDLPVSHKLEKHLGQLSTFTDPKRIYLYCLTCGQVK